MAELTQGGVIPGRVLVTGASGFIGRHLCEHLQARGILVRAAVRGDAAVPCDERAVVPDLLSRPAMDAAMVGVDAVVHLAARVHVMRDDAADPLAEFRAANLAGTRVVLDAAAAAGVRRFVFVSSVKAVGESNLAPWSESVPPHPVDPYGQSKLEAEELVLEHARGHGMEGTVLRLPMTYGPGVKGNFIRLMRWLDAGRPMVVGATPNRRSLAYVGNVVAAIEAVLTHPRAAGERFFVSDGHDVSTEELVRALATALGRPARLVRIPAGATSAVAGLSRTFPRVARATKAQAILDRLTGSLTLDIGKLERLLGFVPPHSFASGIAQTVRWYRASGRAARE